MNQPTIEDAYEVKVENLRFFIPSSMKINEFNGMNVTYNYYISNSFDDCEIYVVLRNKDNYNNSIETFMNYFVKVKDGKYQKEEINNALWYTGMANSNTNTFTTVTDDYFYTISFQNKISGTICSSVLEMINKTLYITDKK